MIDRGLPTVGGARPGWGGAPGLQQKAGWAELSSWSSAEEREEWSPEQGVKGMMGKPETADPSQWELRDYGWGTCTGPN